MVSYLAIGGTIGGISLALYLLRKLVSRKWGYFVSDRNLKGQVIILTGGNVGLGAEVAKDLAARGATLILACRNWDRTRMFLGDLRKKSGNNDIHFIKLDLGSLKSVEEFTAEFKEKYSRLDTLICNAGVWFPMEKQMKTSDGFEIHAGTNHLGHFHLTQLLKETLEATENSRVVVVSSSLMRSGVFDQDAHDHFYAGRQRDPSKKGGHAPTGYCDSKLMNALFTKQIAERHGGTGMMALCVCPGFCYTQLSRNVGIPLYKKILFLPIAFVFMRSAARGAHNIIFAAVEDQNKLVNGGFYRECKVSAEDTKRLDDMQASGQNLWKISEKLCSQ